MDAIDKSEGAKENLPRLTPIKDKLPDSSIRAIKRGNWSEAPSSIELSQNERDLVRGAVDVYKQRHIEMAQIFKSNTDEKSEMKLVGEVVVTKPVDQRLFIRFVTTAHLNPTDGRQWSTAMNIDINPNFNDLAPIHRLMEDKIIGRKKDESFVIIGDINTVEERYGGNIGEELRKNGYSDLALVSISDLDRYSDRRLDLGDKPQLADI